MLGARKIGLPNVYPLVTTALVVAFGATVWSGEKWAPPTASVLAWLALAVAVAAYGLEVRRDPVTAARPALVVSLFWAIFGGGGAAAGAMPFIAPVAAVALFASPAVAAIAWSAWMQWGREGYPNPIRTTFGTHAGEEAGVQLAVAAPESMRTGEIGRLDVYLQNAWDSPRKAVFTVDVVGYARSKVPSPLEVELEPLAAVVVSVPFVVEESERATVDVWSVIEVKGAGGRRRRLWRAPWRAGKPRRAFTPAQAAALARGVAGGIPVRLTVTGPRVPGPPLPEPSMRVIWSAPATRVSMARE